MTEIKPGDTVRYTGKLGRASGTDDLLVIATYDDRIWAKADSGKPLTYKMSEYEKVEPFFEAGKTYTCVGDSFAVKYLEKDGHGGPVAIGILYSPSNGGIWTTKRPGVFTCWDEVEE